MTMTKTLKQPAVYVFCPENKYAMAPFVESTEEGLVCKLVGGPVEIHKTPENNFLIINKKGKKECLPVNKYATQILLGDHCPRDWSQVDYWEAISGPAVLIKFGHKDWWHWKSEFFNQF